MEVPKNALLCQKNIFVEIFGRKGSLEAVKAFSLAKSISTGKSKSFLVQQKKSWKNLN